MRDTRWLVLKRLGLTPSGLGLLFGAVLLGQLA